MSACLTGWPVRGPEEIIKNKWQTRVREKLLDIHIVLNWINRYQKGIKKSTFDVAVVLRMVLRFLVKRYFEFIGHFLPFLWRWMLEEARQMYSKLETDEWKTFYIIGVDLNIQVLWFKNASTWIWQLCLCTQSCWHCGKTHQAAWHLNDTVGKCNIIFNLKKSKQ